MNKCEFCGQLIDDGWPVACLHCADEDRLRAALASQREQTAAAEERVARVEEALDLYIEQHIDDPPNFSPVKGRCVCFCCQTARAALAADAQDGGPAERGIKEDGGG